MPAKGHGGGLEVGGGGQILEKGYLGTAETLGRAGWLVPMTGGLGKPKACFAWKCGVLPAVDTYGPDWPFTGSYYG